MFLRFARAKDLSRLIDQGLREWIGRIGLNEARKDDGFTDVDQLERPANARVRMILVGRAGVVVFEVLVFLADLVGGVGAGFYVVLLMEYLDSEIAEKTLGLRAGLVFSKLLTQVEDVLGEADDCDS